MVTGDYSRGASGFWIENGKRTYAVSEVTIAGHLARHLPHAHARRRSRIPLRHQCADGAAGGPDRCRAVRSRKCVGDLRDASARSRDARGRRSGARDRARPVQALDQRRRQFAGERRRHRGQRSVARAAQRSRARRRLAVGGDRRSARRRLAAGLGRGPDRRHPRLYFRPRRLDHLGGAGRERPAGIGRALMRR